MVSVAGYRSFNKTTFSLFKSGEVTGRVITWAVLFFCSASAQQSPRYEVSLCIFRQVPDAHFLSAVVAEKEEKAQLP